MLPSHHYGPDICVEEHCCHDGWPLFKARHRSTATRHGANQQNCIPAVFFWVLLIKCTVVPWDQSSFVLGSICRAKRLFPAEKSCALDVLKPFQCVSVRACECTFCIIGRSADKGLRAIAAGEQQLSNLTPRLAEVFCLFFPNKLKLKEKEVTFPSPNSILLCLSLGITLSRFSFHYLRISYEKYASLSLSKSVPLNRIHCPDFYVPATSNQGQCWQAANFLQCYKMKELGSLS